MDRFVSRHIQSSLCKLLLEEMPRKIKGFDEDCVERLFSLVMDIQNTKPDLGHRCILRVARQVEHFIRVEFPMYEKNEEVMNDYVSRKGFMLAVKRNLRAAPKRERKNQFIIEKVKWKIAKVYDEMQQLRLFEDDISRGRWSELERRRQKLVEALENKKKIAEEEQRLHLFLLDKYPIMKRGFVELKRMNAKATMENEEKEKDWASVLLKLQNII